MRNLLRRLWAAIEARIAGYPEGCCECGTGGPYYDGPGPQVVRYLYVGACRGNDGTESDWASCSAHPLEWLAPVVDYGRDVEVTIGQARADVAEALASGLTFEPGNGTVREG